MSNRNLQRLTPRTRPPPRSTSWARRRAEWVLSLSQEHAVDANQCNDESGPSLGVPGRGAQVPHAMATGTRSTAKKRTSPLNYGCSRSSPSMWMRGRTLEEIQAGMRQFLLHQPLPVARSAPGNLESKVKVPESTLQPTLGLPRMHFHPKKQIFHGAGGTRSGELETLQQNAEPNIIKNPPPLSTISNGELFELIDSLRSDM
ncbi:hypothetical protein B0H14DRAFT_2582146 [Mycena olivaceomarginata]|nr:hypothetical protein B0H14DRAFT_2582146 [Mycena olivaceomarginata]